MIVIIKKIESFLPIYACLPRWLQIIVLTWIGLGIIISPCVAVFYFKDKREVLNIIPNQNQIFIPSLDDKNAATMIISLNIWAKRNSSLEICLINIEIFDDEKQKYLQYGSKVTDNMGRDLQFPLILKDMKKENILIYMPISNKNTHTFKAKVNFVPYSVADKISAELIIARGINEYQGALFYGKHHAEFGRVSTQGERKIKFLKKYNKPPEISINSQ